MSGIHVAPFPYCYQCRIPTSDECCYESLEQIELLLKQQSAPSETAVRYFICK
jgi:4-aminobutyrate aminotransferase-like enzyme